ncbi:hypothetical protein [Jeotgalicoccus sp. WY2]|uniref:hypothetical protein n=1 Tax=Jeotgalicoccus sp. WY2 TaxID=2708346 RepID=UPI001BD69471|nr:hypothetical protein [Jeotgalicoccus sp. WY2]
MKLIKSKSYFTVDSKDLDSNGVYKYKYQVKKYDEELGKERWMDETKHKMVYPEQINRDGMKIYSIEGKQVIN